MSIGRADGFQEKKFYCLNFVGVLVSLTADLPSFIQLNAALIRCCSRGISFLFRLHIEL